MALEEVYEPYVENSQYKQEISNERRVRNFNRILPSINSEKPEDSCNENYLNVTAGNLTKIYTDNDCHNRKISTDCLANDKKKK